MMCNGGKISKEQNMPYEKFLFIRVHLNLHKDRGLWYLRNCSFSKFALNCFLNFLLVGYF